MSSLEEAIRVFRDAAIRVWMDARVWAEEAENARVIPWPIPQGTTRYDYLWALLVEQEVAAIVQWLILHDDPRTPSLPFDPRDANAQLVLRVVRRAAAVAEPALRLHFGGDRVTGTRDYKNKVAEQLSEDARFLHHAGHFKTLAEAFAFFGIGRRRAYRADDRRRKRKL